jgi:uncharacterized Zn-finger protein
MSETRHDPTIRSSGDTAKSDPATPCWKLTAGLAMVAPKRSSATPGRTESSKTKSRLNKGWNREMTDTTIPHFHNDLGVAVIEIGAKEFMCVGAKPPFDHPHVFCDMGDDVDYVCPYCSTLYRHDPTLAPNAARPAECALISETV